MTDARLTKDDYLKLLQRKRFRKFLLRLMKATHNNKRHQHQSLPVELRQAIAEYEAQGKATQ